MVEEVQPLFFEVYSLEDLVRLAISVVLPAPTQIFHYKEGDSHIYFCLIPVLGLTGAKPVPAVYYCKTLKEVKGPYALIKSDGEPEQVEFADSTKRGWHATVIVNLKKIPESFKFS